MRFLHSFVHILFDLLSARVASPHCYCLTDQTTSKDTRPLFACRGCWRPKGSTDSEGYVTTNLMTFPFSSWSNFFCFMSPLEGALCSAYCTSNTVRENTLGFSSDSCDHSAYSLTYVTSLGAVVSMKARCTKNHARCGLRGSVREKGAGLRTPQLVPGRSYPSRRRHYWRPHREVEHGAPREGGFFRLGLKGQASLGGVLEQKLLIPKPPRLQIREVKHELLESS